MLLNKAELLEKYYTRGNPIDDADVDLYLSRANTWCIGYIGGVPPLLPGEPQDRPGLKIAVATCFEIMARGETKQINPDTGNITEVAPPTGAVKTSTQYKAFDQFANGALLKKLGVHTAEGALSTLLPPGEIVNFAVAVQNASGFGNKAKKKVKDSVKNS